PHFHDWYETVKVNYGVKPDGSYDFDKLPESFRLKGYQQHYKFWTDKDVPRSWSKFRDIVLYWTEFGVDGFRYDMAEMVPVEFWSYLNSSIKMKNANSFLLAEVYNPKIYRDYLQLGLMDSLYDKVDFYDTLKLVMQGKAPTSKLTPIVNTYADIDDGMLHFLENHDEQRIASPDFAGDPRKGMPAMVVSSLIGKGATLLYFAQALGEAGEGDAGFGDPTRTTIFDYWGLAKLKRWDSDGSYNGSQLLPDERALQVFYQKLLSFTSKSKALDGEYADLHQFNLESIDSYDEKIYSFVRWSPSQRVLVISNFSETNKGTMPFKVPVAVASQWKLKGDRLAKNIFDDKKHKLVLDSDGGITINISLDGFESKVLVF
ncbi:MAG: alpha-amylase family glycosyl hydrolase, partial [Kangiellaceae bacterium]|nr:alpha-amylase family glycosyl hydrolase [Kangiellaceae bacterium]